MSEGPAQFHSLLHSADIIEKKLSTLLSSINIRPRQARVLNALMRMGAASQVELADGFGVTAGSMSTMIDRLLAADLIIRCKNPTDRREDIVALTASGEVLVKEIRSLWRDVDELIIAAIGADKAAQLTGLTNELKCALGGKVVGQGKPRRDLTQLLREIQEIQEQEKIR